MQAPSSDTIRIRASQVAFGDPVVQNNFRAVVVEAIAECALKPAWRWCSRDWYGWDFVHEDGTRLEVKQSAVRQTWAAAPKPSKPRFDIRNRVGFYEGSAWYAQPGRHANIYVFAYHPITDESADHRDARQWQFFVIPTTMLPRTNTISLSALTALSPSCEWSGLPGAVEAHRCQHARDTSPRNT
jgi:hypothetical protein